MIIGQVLGGIILLLWLLLIPVGRYYIRSHGSVEYATVFQYHVLPLIVGISLLISGNLWHLAVGIAAWFLSIIFPWFFLYIFPLVFGSTIGAFIFSNMFPDSIWWRRYGGLIGIIGMFIVCSVIVAVITTSRKEPLERIDNILKYLFNTLFTRYDYLFPDDMEDTNLRRAAVVLNELVLQDNQGYLVDFRHENAEFVDSEKSEVMMVEGVREGVLGILAAKGGLYRLRGDPDADMWISEAKKIDPDINIPNTLEEVQRKIALCLFAKRALYELRTKGKDTEPFSRLMSKLQKEPNPE